MGLGALIVTLVLLVGTTVSGLVAGLVAVVVCGPWVRVEDSSIVGGSCGESFVAIVLQARAMKTHGRAIATPSRKRWSAINQ
jgi:hypothetical protein